MLKSLRSAVFTLGSRPFFLAAASGALSALSVVFPPVFFLIWMAFVPLFLSLRAQPTGKRLVIGLITGIVYFGGAFYWLWSSTVHFFAFSLLTASLLFLCFLLWHGFFSRCLPRLCANNRPLAPGSFSLHSCGRC